MRLKLCCGKRTFERRGDVFLYNRDVLFVAITHDYFTILCVVHTVLFEICDRISLLQEEK